MGDDADASPHLGAGAGGGVNAASPLSLVGASAVVVVVVAVAVGSVIDGLAIAAGGAGIALDVPATTVLALCASLFHSSIFESFSVAVITIPAAPDGRRSLHRALQKLVTPLTDR
jgi:hypothetical protein